MKRKILVILILIVFSVVYSQKKNFQEINSINYSQEKEKFILSLGITGPVNYYVFKVSNPPRLVIEMSSTLYSLPKKEYSVNSPYIKKIRGGQYKDDPVKISRIVLDLKKDVFYDAISNGRSIIFAISDKKELAKVEIKPRVPEAEKVIAKLPEKKRKKIRIRRNIPTEEHLELIRKIREGEKKEKLKKKEKVERRKRGIVSLSEKRISVNFYEADIRNVLDFIAQQAGVNFVYGPDVQGNITIKLRDVKFDDAFRIILKMSGLVAEREADNIIRIITPAQLKKERAEAVTFTRIIPLRFARAQDVQKQLQTITIEGVKATIGIDETTNSLIITATQDALKKYEELIKYFDRKPRQVLIEAKIVEVDYSNSLDLGISWQGVFGPKEATSGNIERNIGDGTVKYEWDESQQSYKGETGTGKIETQGITPPVYFGGGAVSSQGLFFNVGGVYDRALLEAALAALATKGKAKILSNPKVVAMNNEQAYILSGEQVPYTQTTVTPTGTTQSTSFTDVGIKLTVTPTINSDEYVTLEIQPEVSTVRQFLPEGPWIVTRQATTKVMVKDGDTIVIGGLIREEELESMQGVPFLSELPILGYLFKRHQQTKDRVELLVFITPHILKF
ncbi:MAG: hypothetical protein DRI36_01470 [Caldiserica bacterium]|nr:MAG: hypothetical protein DRI36_01470 [Caldisericota bacterium]